QGLLDELPMLRGIDLAAEKATCREDDHGRELAAELRERLIVQRLRVGLALLTDAVGLGSRLSAKVRGCRLRRLRRAVRDRGGLGACLREQLLDLLLPRLTIPLRL